jgi:hypothetical protein
LTTRKAAIPFDREHDVIAEVYDSWYQLFKSLRELEKNVPVRKGMRADSDEAKLVTALSGALNVGLRPHLTMWQARFRRWYEVAVSRAENAYLSPQEIQKQFSEYETLVSDLEKVNKGLMTFAESLRVIAHERVRLHWWDFRLRKSLKKANT